MLHTFTHFKKETNLFLTACNLQRNLLITFNFEKLVWTHNMIAKFDAFPLILALG